jgi:hypothetical protein
MNIASEIYYNACACFERQIEEVAVRKLGCGMEQGLKSGRLTVHQGQPFVDGRQICFVQPPRLRGMEIVWVFVDLTGEVKS